MKMVDMIGARDSQKYFTKRNERLCGIKRQENQKDVFFLYYMPELCRDL